MRHPLLRPRPLVLSLMAAALLAGCTGAQLQTAQNAEAQGQLVINAAACGAQKLANDETAAAQAAGNAKAAADGQLASAVAGSLCMTTAPAPAAPVAAPAAAATQ
jgi:hypothetical protein